MKNALLLIMTLGLGGCYLSVNTALGPSVARARAQHAPVLIYALGVPGQIAVPGVIGSAVPVYVQFLVTGTRPIARIRFVLRAYSQRGDAVHDRQGNQLQMILIGPGIFDPDKLYEVNSFHSRPAGFPGGGVACVELSRMTIIYANGDREKFILPRLKVTLMPQLQHECPDHGPAISDLFSDRSS
jgi:hypothetical protein